MFNECGPARVTLPLGVLISYFYESAFLVPCCDCLLYGACFPAAYFALSSCEFQLEVALLSHLFLIVVFIIFTKLEMLTFYAARVLAFFYLASHTALLSLEHFEPREEIRTLI